MNDEKPQRPITFLFWQLVYPLGVGYLSHVCGYMTLAQGLLFFTLSDFFLALALRSYKNRQETHAPRELGFVFMALFLPAFIAASMMSDTRREDNSALLHLLFLFYGHVALRYVMYLAFSAFAARFDTTE